MAMAKLQMLKPRVATLSTARAAPLTGTGWRAGKETSAQRGYGYAWQQARERFLREHPLCCYCERDGRLAAATVVDHRVPHRGDERLFWDETNWQPLCRPCHDVVKRREEQQG
jgi:5-methylcytosine-specific restriction endonuclease McrA